MNTPTPEDTAFVSMTTPVTTNGGVTGDYISLKLAQGFVYMVCTFTQAVAHATGIDPVQASAVAGTGVKAITKTCRIWANSDLSLTSALTAQTAAITYNLANTAKNQKVIFEIDPAGLDVANGFDCLGVTVDDSSQATNFVNIELITKARYVPALDMLID